MQAEDFLQTLHSTKLEPVYLFLGASAFLMEEAWKKLHSRVFPKGTKSLSVERFQAKETPPGHVMERLQTIPMFGPNRFMVVENVEAWEKGDRASFETFLQRIPSSACLVLTASAKKGIDSLVKIVESRGKVVQFRAPNEREAPRWLMDQAKGKGKTLSLRAAFLLVEMIGEDFSSLSSELEKVCTFVGERENIEAEDIQEAVSSQRTFSMFDLLDQVKARQAGKAVRSLRSLLLSGEPALKILASLAWQIRVLWQVKDGLRSGMPEVQLSEKLKLHAFVVKKAREQAVRFSDSDLYEILDAIRQADLAIKSTGSSPEAMLEELLIGLCLKNEKPPGALRGLR